MKLLPQMYYFETAKVMPTAADGYSVLMFNIELQQWVSVPVLVLKHDSFKKLYSHWTQLPKAPADDHPHAFLE